MLIIRNEKFVKINEKIFLMGSSSNELYLNNIYQMGDITILGWLIDNFEEENSKKIELLQNDRLHIILYPDCLPLRKKAKLIKKHVKEAECLSLKFCFIDSFIACHYANRYKKKYVIESGTDAFKSTWYHGGSIKYKLGAIPYEMLTKYYHWKAENVIYVSKKYLQNKYRSTGNQIGCSDTVLMDVSDDILQNRIKRIELDKTKIVLGLIGAARAEYRGHDILIRTASALVDKGYDIEVRFLGSKKGKEKRSSLANSLKIQDKVYFDGYKDKKGVYEWIDNIDILVMPTLAETLGRAVIEAMSLGCPVIGSSETALSEQLGSDCIASARDIKAISLIIEHMILDREYMKYCAYENFYRAKKYNSNVTNKERKKFYDEFYMRIKAEKQEK